MNKLFLLSLILFTSCRGFAEDGYRLWLRYNKVSDNKLLSNYGRLISTVVFEESSPTLDAAKKELVTGLEGLLNKKIHDSKTGGPNTIIVFKKKSSLYKGPAINYTALGKEG